MTPHRTIVRSLVAATGLLAIAAPALAVAPAVPTAVAPADPAPVVAAAAPVGTGTAATTSIPLHVAVAGLPIDLGTTVVSATNDPTATALAPWSGAAVTLANIGGARFGDLAVRSDGSTSNNGASLTRSTLAGPVGAALGDLVATADAAANSATAGLTTLTTTATVLEGLGLEATVTDVVTTVDDSGASATHGLAVAGLDLDLADVLGDALDLLSLEQLLDLADLLDLPIDRGVLDDVDELMIAVEELLLAIDDVDGAADAVTAAAAALVAQDDAAAAPLGSFGDVDDTTALLTSLQGLLPNGVTEVQETIVVNAVDPLATLLGGDAYAATGCADTATLAEAIACVEGHLAGQAAAQDALAPQLAALETAVDDYLAAVLGAQVAADDLDDLTALLPDGLDGLLSDITLLVEGVLATELLSVGDVQVAQQVRAIGDDLDGSSASAVCEATTVAVLGGTPLAIEDCAAPQGTLDTLEALVETTLGEVLTTVGGVDVGDGVELDLFGIVENATTETDGVVTSTSVVEVLSLTVPEITVTPCDVLVVGEAACLLFPTLDGALGDTLETATGVLGDVQSEVTAALGDGQLDALLQLLDDADVADVGLADGVGDGVGDALAAVDGVIDGLNLDGILAGEALRLPGAEIVVDPQLEARHGVTAAGAPTDPAPTPTNPAPTPSGPNLPNTGGGAALLAVLALGAGAWLWRRKETSDA